jgi:hypothetical protein
MVNLPFGQYQQNCRLGSLPVSLNFDLEHQNLQKCASEICLGVTSIGGQSVLLGGGVLNQK